MTVYHPPFKFNHVDLPPMDEPESFESDFYCEVCGRSCYYAHQVILPPDNAQVRGFVCYGCWEAATDEQRERWENGY